MSLFETIRTFGDSIFSEKIIRSDAEDDQSKFLKNMVVFNNKFRPRIKEGKMKKKLLKV